MANPIWESQTPPCAAAQSMDVRQAVDGPLSAHGNYLKVVKEIVNFPQNSDAIVNYLCDSMRDTQELDSNYKLVKTFKSPFDISVWSQTEVLN